jgi:glyoxylase-like metal-dependent hydrolase (beta-lactamase superfamily II)
VSIIDAGWPKDYERVVASLEQIGRTPADVDSIVLTHAHIDHMGAAEELRTRHGIPVHAHHAEEELARGLRHEGMTTAKLISLLWRPSVLRFAVVALGRGGTSLNPLGEVATFEEGAALDTAGSPVPVHVPGHTSGSAAYHLPDRGVLVTGDALVSIHITTEELGARVMPSDFNHDHAAAVSSLQRLRNLEAGVIAPGHGPVMQTSPARAVEEALSRV